MRGGMISGDASLVEVGRLAWCLGVAGSGLGGLGGLGRGGGCGGGVGGLLYWGFSLLVFGCLTRGKQGDSGAFGGCRGGWERGGGVGGWRGNDFTGVG